MVMDANAAPYWSDAQRRRQAVAAAFDQSRRAARYLETPRCPLPHYIEQDLPPVCVPRRVA